MIGRCQQGRTVFRWLRWGVAALVLSCQATSDPVLAFETDQYLALDEQIADSAFAVNAYLNQELETFLSRPATGQLSCRQIPSRFYRHLFQGLLASRLQKYLKSDSAIDLFPDDLGYREHLRRSVYRRLSFPYVLPLSPTIRIGEVRFGLDKFGHLFGFGRRYYKHYVRLRARGGSEEEAVRAVVRRGLHQERLFVGGLADGVFSYSDLEANYQGMELARHFCHGESAYIERSSSRWSVRREIDLRTYVTPSFDESYNNNHYPRPRWNKVRPILVAEYCDRFFSPAIQARMKRYEVIDRPNPSKQIIDEYFERKGRNPQQRQSMDSICERPAVATFATTALR